MRSFFNGLMLGLILGGGLGWFLTRQWQQNDSPEGERFRSEATRAVDAAGEALFRAGEALKAKAEALNLNPEQIREELARTGQIVRRQARELVGPSADAETDAAITAALKTKLAEDPELSPFAIRVSMARGHVTLEGKVGSAEHIGRAVTLALGTDGVVDVTAKLQVTDAK
jgi:hyperosmotically inducible periplasmic protein